jgi:hypothetical protein
MRWSWVQLDLKEQRLLVFLLAAKNQSIHTFGKKVF